jgi:type III pantothenate kinase
VSSLLVDIGNSRIKWAVNYRDRLEVGQPLSPVDGVFDFAGRWNFFDTPERVLVSNVQGDDIAHSLQQWIEERWGVSVEFIRPASMGFGVANGYLDPNRLGADRWICLIAARASFKDPCCIVDCGTAITADVVDGMGRHQGGVICPGLRLMRQALIGGTRRLSLEGLAPGGLLGRDTGAGIYSGTLNAAAGMIEKLVGEAEQSIGAKLKLVLTGGDADLIAERLEVGYTIIPDLVLRGLAVIESGGQYGKPRD